MSMTPQLRAEIARRAPPDQIEDLLRREGMKSMAQDGLEKALSGGTTVEEVLRVAGAQS
jgi:type II secretory ATPase GspE/PulE/Tfp pilus assembly ATPase PilB-like protein